MKNYNFQNQNAHKTCLLVTKLINVRLISVGFLRVQSLVHLMASQSGMMSSFLIRSTFLTIDFSE